MTKFNWSVGQVVGQTSDYGTKRKGTVLSVTPTGRATVEMTNADGHKFTNVFTAEGRRFPKIFMYTDGMLRPWTSFDDVVWREQVAEHRRRQRTIATRTRNEQEQADLDAVAMSYAITLLKQSVAPASARAIAIINRWGFTEQRISPVEKIIAAQRK